MVTGKLLICFDMWGHAVDTAPFISPLIIIEVKCTA